MQEGELTDKCKENGILHFPEEIVGYHIEVGDLKKEASCYNSIYKELAEIVGVDATLKIYLIFKGQQITFPVRLYSPDSIKEIVIREFDGGNLKELARKYGYSEKTIRRMIRSNIEAEEQR